MGSPGLPEPNHNSIIESGVNIGCRHSMLLFGGVKPPSILRTLQLHGLCEYSRVVWTEIGPTLLISGSYSSYLIKTDSSARHSSSSYLVSKPHSILKFALLVTNASFVFTMSSETIFITGANTGLGLETVRALCNEPVPYNIIIGSRDYAKGEEAVSQLRREFPQTASSLSAVQIDVTSDDSIKNAVDQIATTHGQLDVLINNAGAVYGTSVLSGEMSLRESWNKSWDTNVTGAHVTTSMFMPLLLKSASPRLLFITSGTAPLAETERTDAHFAFTNASPDAGWPKPLDVNLADAYRSAKTGLNMMMRQWHRTLKNDRVKVFAVSPGFLATNLAGLGPEALKKVRPAYSCSVLPD